MRDAELLAAEVAALAGALDVRIAVAESLTGGMLAAALVAVPGVSRVFSGGVVAYDTALKASLLGVDARLLLDRGPVDAEVARQMAAGVRRACAVPAQAAAAGQQRVPAGLGVSTTGVAGPEPDAHTGQRAGTVWLGVSSRLGERAVLLEDAATGRAAVRAASVIGALELLRDELGALSDAR